jgi:hypothetical protein
MTRRHQSRGPVGESNRHLAVQMAKMPQTPEAMKRKNRDVPWGAIGMAVAIVVAVAWVAFWTALR